MRGAERERLDEESANALVGLIDGYVNDDEAERSRVVDACLKAAAYWEGDQDLYEHWEGGSFEMRSQYQSEDWEDAWGGPPNRVINIYRVHGESVIAATVSDVPGISFWPDDADSEDDKATAMAWTAASELIQRQNQHAHLDRRAALHVWLYGHTYSYTWTEEDPLETERGWPAGENVPIQDREWTEIPKTRQRVEILSPREVHADSRAERLEDTPYLVRHCLRSRAWLMARYPEYAERFEQETEGYADAEDPNAAWQHGERGEGSGDDTGSGWINVRYCWIQNWALRDRQGLDPEKDAVFARLREEFPSGAHLLIVGRDLVYARDERLLDHWTRFERSIEEGANPPAQGRQTMESADMENEAVNAMVDIVKHAVPSLFSVGSVVDPEEFASAPLLAGQWHRTSEPPPGKSLGESFYQPQGTRLPDGIEHVLGYLKTTSEKLSGDLPSIMGAPNQGGSKTLGEWMDSKAQATKRLDITYFDLADFKAQTMGKAVALYFDAISRPDGNGMIYDRKTVEKQGSEYVNVWIRHSQLQGRVGDVTPEAVRGVPLSIHEQRRLVLELASQPSPLSETLLSDPGNLGEAVRLLGLSSMAIPHADATDKQNAEIQELLKSKPEMTVDERTGKMVPALDKEGIPQSTIPPHDTDYHEIEAEAIRKWASSLPGRVAFEESPEGFMNVMFHYAQHAAIISRHNAQAQASGVPPQESERLSSQGGLSGGTGNSGT